MANPKQDVKNGFYGYDIQTRRQAMIWASKKGLPVLANPLNLLVPGTRLELVRGQCLKGF